MFSCNVSQHNSIDRQIEVLRAQLESIAFASESPDEMLTLSRRLDRLINKAMLSPHPDAARACYKPAMLPHRTYRRRPAPAHAYRSLTQHPVFFLKNTRLP